MERPAVGPHLFVVLGATGDLMQRKLLPALYRLRERREFPAGSVVLGVARRPMDDASFGSAAVGWLAAEKVGTAEALKAFARTSLAYHRLEDDSPESFGRLGDAVAALEKARGLTGDRIFYLALPPEALRPTLDGLGGAGLATGPGWTRVVVEKPFGRDLASAQALNAALHAHFAESQVYRIDHYLGKETVQNLLVFRFANMFVESLWNRERVERVEITVAESLGIEGRAAYYETSGALRDMIQNHVTQILTLVAMEPPATRTEEAIRNEKVKVLRSIAPITPSDVVRGQYTAGSVGGTAVPGYLAEPGVAPGSTTETYAALRLRVTNWRWQGVPFFLRSGKRLPAKSSRVVLTLKAPPVSFFPTEQEYEMNPDRISILIQPAEGFEIAFEIKVPGRELRVQTHRMKFHYADVFGPLPDGYETLLLDAMLGDPTLFVRADEVEESWRVYDAVLANPPAVTPYAAGSWGPESAQRLAEQWGHRWWDDSA
ncbi:MAG TPA: glucose-6-phosphate dehydrogenase [Thermoplasmata archaeon]|nr:glucose-6-phosphate dehydrogenase [Thermoplasmata archaeon]